MQLIFGIRTTGTVTLTVTATGALPAQPPELRIKTAGEETVVTCTGSSWVANVTAGDSIVYIPDQGDRCLSAALAFTLSTPATIITVASPGTSPVSWTASAGAGSNNVKDPWPPPPLSIQVAPLTDPGWIGSTLGTMSRLATPLRDASSEAPTAVAGRNDHYR